MALRTSYADGEVLNAADVNAITTKVNQIDEDMIPKSGGTMTGTLGIGTSATSEVLSLIIRRLVADVGYRYLQWYVSSTGSAALSLRDADGAELNGFALTPDATLLSKALAVTGGGTGSKTAAGARANMGIQAGRVTITAAGGTVTTHQVTFATAFAAAPIVTATAQGAFTNPAYNNDVFVNAITTTGFELRVLREMSTETSFPVNWIAIG